jgi:hypothetical protein
VNVVTRRVLSPAEKLVLEEAAGRRWCQDSEDRKPGGVVRSRSTDESTVVRHPLGRVHVDRPLSSARGREDRPDLHAPWDFEEEASRRIWGMEQIALDPGRTRDDRLSAGSAAACRQCRTTATIATATVIFIGASFPVRPWADPLHGR